MDISEAGPSSAGASRHKRSGSGKADGKKPSADKVVHSISNAAQMPKSLRPTGAPVVPVHSLKKIKDKKLRSHLRSLHDSSIQASTSAADAQDMLLPDEGGFIETEGELERTWKVGQQEIKESVGMEAARKGFELKLGGQAGLGPYAIDYSRNGRHLALAGRKGHVATLDWQTGAVKAELHLNETVRDIKFLHNQTMFAVAQKKYVFIYDDQGIELHKLKSHIEVNRMEFLPYHWLLATVGNAGYLKYQDTSTGQGVAELRTKLGSCDTMALNNHNAIVHLGHQNGTVSLWSPNLSNPAVKILAHMGPVRSIAVDPSSGGTYFATSGLDGKMKVWDSRKWGVVKEWQSRKPASSLAWSQKGLLGVGWGNHVSIYKDVKGTSLASLHPESRSPYGPGPYLSHDLPGLPVHDVAFCPFEDVLGVGHAGGFTSVLVPGAGEPNFDSSEADPFEKKKTRQEREVHSLMDKIQPDMISLDPNFIGKLDTNPKRAVISHRSTSGRPAPTLNRNVSTPFARMSRGERLKVLGTADESGIGLGLPEPDGGYTVGAAPTSDDEGREERIKEDKHKMKGKGKSMKRFLRKKKKNIIDPATVAIKEKMMKQRAQRDEIEKVRRAEKSGIKLTQPETSSLDRFKSKPRY
uniref:U three protein 7 n=1 Tax=Bartheletia paradoxa TaxID=669517 RepID=A0A2D0XHP3_9BASI|nr:hypothetical protein SPAR07250 [Bartheletia paradoxa]